MAIGTRVTVTHGGHPGTDEPKVLGWASLALLGAALLSRLAGGEVDPTRSHALAGAAAALSAGAQIVAQVERAPRGAGVLDQRPAGGEDSEHGQHPDRPGRGRAPAVSGRTRPSPPGPRRGA